jgi:hypothetical protein
MGEILHAIAVHGDIGHVALSFCLIGAFALIVLLLRQLGEARAAADAAHRRFDIFVTELARFNRQMADEA